MKKNSLTIFIYFAIYSTSAFSSIDTTFVTPVPNGGTSEGVRPYNYLVGTKHHTGSDIQPVTSGEYPKIFSTNFGKITSIASNDGINDHGFGNSIEVRHLMQNGTYKYIRYGHMNDGVSIPNNSHIAKNQYISRMGGTGYGRNGYTPNNWTSEKQNSPRTYGWMHHLHYEVYDASGFGDFGYSSTDPINHGYQDPYDYMRNSSSTTIQIPFTSRTNNYTAATYDVYGIAGQNLYASLNVSGDFYRSAILVRKTGDRSRTEDPTASTGLTSDEKFLVNNFGYVPAGIYGSKNTYTEGDYLLTPFIDAHNRDARYGYPLKFSFIRQGDILIDNDQSNADDLTNNDSQNTPVFNGSNPEITGGSKAPGYYLTSDIHPGRSNAFAQWKPNAAGQYEIYVHIPEYGPTATSVKYVIKTDGTDQNSITSQAINQLSKKNEWVKITGSNGVDRFNLSAHGYVGLSLANSTNSSNYQAIDENMMVAVDAVKFIKISEADASTWTTGSYGNKENIIKTLSIAGATSLTVRVVGETEKGFDYIYIYDQYGNLVKTLTGIINHTFVVNGSSIKARLETDYSETRSGVTVSISASNQTSTTLTNREKSDLLMTCLENKYASLFPERQATQEWPQSSSGLTALVRVYSSGIKQAILNGSFYLFDRNSWAIIASIDDTKSNFCPAAW